MLNLKPFNEKFLGANRALTRGNTEGLKIGIVLLAESLEYAGDYARDILPAIRLLRTGLSHKDRAETKGPWNRDLTGYGLWVWESDLYDRNQDLNHEAWCLVRKVNDDLLSLGLGCKKAA